MYVKLRRVFNLVCVSRLESTRVNSYCTKSTLSEHGNATTPVEGNQIEISHSIKELLDKRNKDVEIMRQEYYVNLGLMRQDYDAYLKSFESKMSGLEKLEDNMAELLKSTKDSLHKLEVNIIGVNILVGIFVTAVASFSGYFLRKSIIDSKKENQKPSETEKSKS